MAEFSKEWCDKNNSSLHPDFSIAEIFQGLKEGHSEVTICEGLGKIKILDVDGECYIKLPDGTKKTYEELTGEPITKKENYSGLIKLMFAIAGAWLLFWIIMQVFYAYQPKESASSDRGTIGDMFGVINALFSGLALAGVIYAIFLQRNELRLQRRELRETRKEFESQNKTLSFQRFENTFFQMIDLHHEIVDKLTHRDQSEFYNPQVGTIETDDLYEKRNMLAFAQKVLKKSLIEKSEDIHNKVIESSEGLVEFPNEHAWNNIQSGYKDFYYTKSFKMQLSHYFRNLYHIFKFIHQSHSLSESQQKRYSSIVRAQLSQSELFLIFYNSMYERHGNPKFLFLVKKYDILDNFDYDDISGLSSHREVFDEVISLVEDQIHLTQPQPVIPSDKYYTKEKKED